MIRARRCLFFGLVAATTLAGTTMMLGITGAAGITLLEIVILGLFVPTFGWIALTFWGAVTGFILTLLRRDPITLDRLGPSMSADGRPSTGTAKAGGAPIVTRTALVMPAHNEDPGRLIGGLEATLRSLEATGRAGHFDVHLLSDTTDPDMAVVEESMWADMRSRSPRPGRLHYRRRAGNIDHKAGNIADFCRTWGDEYDFMVVLDADSLMSGTTVVDMVREMQGNPRAGLIQSVPLPARQETLFGRFIQFAGTLYSPMLATGHAFWQVESGNYWGHNAILRMKPFIEHGRLPVLPGKPPMGGRILSHDFVEAALLRRAGWFVYIRPSLEGSYEEVPTNVLDFAKRDRRWAQGSLQHLRLLFGHGFHPLSRLHFFLGAMGYLASVLWLLILLASTAYVLLPSLSTAPLFTLGGFASGGGPGLLTRGSTLLPFEPGRLPPLLTLTAIVLFLPKGLGLMLALVRRRAGFGGGPALIVSATLETVFSVVIAPVMMMYHTAFVLSIVAGRNADWGRQARSSRNVSWSEAVRRTFGLTAVGVVWAGVTLWASPMFFLWLSPIFVGLLLAAPVVQLSSSPRLGQLARRVGILLVPIEIQAPAEVVIPAVSSVPGDATPVGDPIVSGKPGSSMHEAERGLFDLRRGRPLFVTPSGSSDGEGVLCSAVEGLDPTSLSAMKGLGSGPARLIVTPSRARAMGIGETAGTGEAGLDERAGPSAGVPLSLALHGESTVELFRLSSAEGGFDSELLAPRPASETEVAALDLVRFGGLLPAVVTVPALPDRVPELREALDDGAVLRVRADQIRALASAQGAGVVVTHVSDAQVPLPETEDARFMLFRETNGLLEHVAILVGDRAQWPDPLPVRLHSACLTGDLFGSLRCDCGEQLRGSLQSFAKNGGGVLLYLQQEGRGIGLGNKLRAYALQHEGLDTIDADRMLGFGADERRYDAAVGMLKHLGVERVRILTNNPEKVRALEEGGIEVMDREPIHGTLNRHNLPYVRAKVQRAGHWLGDMLHGGFTGA